MKTQLLVIGGSGHVGGLILPYLAEHYTLRVFDLKAPVVGEWVQGDVRDADHVADGPLPVDPADDEPLLRDKVFQLISIIQNAGAVAFLTTDIPYGSQLLS